MEVNFCKDTLRISYDHENENSELETIILFFKGGNQITYQGEEAQRFFRHFLNGCAVKDISEIPSPDPVEWKEQSKYKN